MASVRTGGFSSPGRVVPSHTHARTKPPASANPPDQSGDAADNESMYTGFNNDNYRLAHPNFPPMQDTPGYSHYGRFGSPHPAGCNFAFCDGSVRKLSFNIRPDLYGQLGGRNDKGPTSFEGL